MAVKPARGIVRQIEQQFGPEHRPRCGSVRRHPDRRAMRAGRSPELAKGLDEMAFEEIDERLLHDRDALAHRKQAFDVVLIENDQLVPVPRSVIFDTRQLPSSAAQSSFSVRHSSWFTPLNSFAIRPARPNLPSSLPVRSTLKISPSASMSSGTFEFDTYITWRGPDVMQIARGVPTFSIRPFRLPSPSKI